MGARDSLPQDMVLKGGPGGQLWEPNVRERKGHFYYMEQWVLVELHRAGQEWAEMNSEMQAEPGCKGMVLQAVIQTLGEFDFVG